MESDWEWVAEVIQDSIRDWWEAEGIGETEKKD